MILPTNSSINLEATTAVMLSTSVSGLYSTISAPTIRPVKRAHHKENRHEVFRGHASVIICLSTCGSYQGWRICSQVAVGCSNHQVPCVKLQERRQGQEHPGPRRRRPAPRYTGHELQRMTRYTFRITTHQCICRQVCVKDVLHLSTIGGEILRVHRLRVKLLHLVALVRSRCADAHL